MRRSPSVLALAVMLMLPPAAWSQTREITGTVTIAGSSVPLIGATVSVEGTTLATLTGPEGRFRLTVPSGPQAVTARYIGYRFWYLALRALWNARKEPAALAMIWGYLKAALNREPQLADADARAYLRRQQSLRLLPSRAAEAIGRRRRVAA